MCMCVCMCVCLYVCVRERRGNVKSQLHMWHVLKQLCHCFSSMILFFNFFPTKGGV